MKALFLTTGTDHEQSLLDTWSSIGHTSERVCYDLRGACPDDALAAAAQLAEPDIIFYSGGAGGSGMPTLDLFRALRKRAPLVHMCWDSADEPWHSYLDEYRSVFTLQVGLDGVRSAPVDHVTLYPTLLEAFPERTTPRPHKCGFAGDFPDRHEWLESKKYRLTHPDAENPRATLLHTLDAPLTIQRRSRECPFSEYVLFLQTCRMALNTAYTGSGKRMHMKMRHMEIPLAGCALVDNEGSPASDWFPHGSYFTYGSARELEQIIYIADDDEITRRAGWLRKHVIDNYSPAKIYGGILDSVRRTE